MKKRIIVSFLAVILTLSLLVLSGCNQTQPETTEQTEMQEQTQEETQQIEDTQEQNTEATMQEAETEPETVEEETTEEIDYFETLPKAEQQKIKYIRNLMDEARTQQENYFFRYSGPGVLQNDVWVKNGVIKRAILRYDDLDKFKTYNMVYMFRDTKKAEGYCETSKSKCWEGHGPFPESYTKWKIKTPKDWLLELDNNFRWALDNKIHDQLYHIIDYEKNGKTTRVWINDYKGWPYRVEVHNGKITNDMDSGREAEESYIYNDMDIGGVSDNDVIPGS